MRFLARKTVKIGVGQEAGFGEDVPEGVVKILGDDGLGVVDQHRHVPVAVGMIIALAGKRRVGVGLGCPGEQAADAACSFADCR